MKGEAVMKNPALVCLLGVALAGMPALMGCDETVSKKEVEVKRDGETVKKEVTEVKKDVDDGKTVVKEEVKVKKD